MPLVKFISQLFLTKFIEEYVEKFADKIVKQSASVNWKGKIGQKYTNAINNVEVKIKNYIFALGLMLMAVFLVIIGVLTIVLSLLFYLFSLNQVATPFLVFGIILVIASGAMLYYMKKTLDNISAFNKQIKQS